MTESASQKTKPISHRKPDLATVRELYGTAFRCGKPDCGRPLYTMNNDTGETLLNSHVAHICARSEGGPRWDPMMSEAENRSSSNLMPMCLEHAREIDVTPEHYPVDLLREWKRDQVAEHFKVQKAWPLTDDEAAQVIEASFQPDDYGIAIAAASSVTGAARAAGHLVESARQQRRVPREAAASWNVMRIGVQRSIPRGWDAETGDLLPPAEPSHVETVPFAQNLELALRQSEEALLPLVATLVAELHAVRAAAPATRPWCDWVESIAGVVLRASGRWPGRPPEEDDDILGEAIAELLRSSTALSATWRGQPADQPPEPAAPSPQPTETETARLAREHSELLDRARPWARVDTRAFDPTLYAELVEAARFALNFPPLMSFLTVELGATARLTAKVARNADDATFEKLIDEASTRQPLAVAVHLARALMFVAREAQRAELEAKSRDQATHLLTTADWTEAEAWSTNRFHIRPLLGWTASIQTDDEVRDRVAAALADRPELLEPIIVGLAQYSEQLDRDDFSRTVSIGVHVEEIPAWVPLQELTAEIRRRFPDLKASSRDDRPAHEDETQQLAAHILYIASLST